MHKKSYLVLALFIAISPLLYSQEISPEDLLERSIRYHDPKGIWGKKTLKLQLQETRPGSPDRLTNIFLDPKKSLVEIDQLRDGNQLFYRLAGEDCTFKLNGSTEISEADREKFRMSCDRAKGMSNFYTYLWSLPMKLRDEGTQLQEVKRTSFMERDAYSLKVTYAPEVGSDVWYFYFDPTTYALIGYRFYHHEADNDGEYITLSGEETIKGLRLPKERKWYAHKEDEFLGTDVLQR